MPKLPEECIKGVGELDDKYGRFSLSFTDFRFTIPSRFCILFSYDSNSATRFSYYSVYSSNTVLITVLVRFYVANLHTKILRFNIQFLNDSRIPTMRVSTVQQRNG